MPTDNIGIIPTGSQTFKSVRECLDFRAKLASENIAKQIQQSQDIFLRDIAKHSTSSEHVIHGSQVSSHESQCLPVSFSRTREGSIAQPKSSCQDRLSIASFFRQRFKTIPMPDEVRKMHEKDGDLRLDDSIPYVLNGSKDNGL